MIKFIKNLSKKLNKTLTEDVPEGFADAFLSSPSFPVRAAAAFCFVAVSLGLILPAVFRDQGRRCVFFFPQAAAVPGGRDGFSSVVPEIRYIESPGDCSERLSAYVSEILLGSTIHTALPVFPPECRLSECFVRGEEAFIDIALVSPADVLTDTFFSNKCELFKKNICTNFRNIDTIHLYFDGIEVYSEKR